MPTFVAMAIEPVGVFELTGLNIAVSMVIKLLAMIQFIVQIAKDGQNLMEIVELASVENTPHLPLHFDNQPTG